MTEDHITDEAAEELLQRSPTLAANFIRLSPEAPHGRRRFLLSDEAKNQEQIEHQLQEANKSFTNARKGDSSTRDREKALQDLENGYLKYKEIKSNIEVGQKFYNDLAKLVGRYREDCKKFVHQRRVEATQLETYFSPLL